MKKLFTTLLILSGIYFTASAQTANTVEFGVHAGYNESYVIDTYSGSNSSWISGFNAGVSADYYLSERWSIKGEVMYDQKGWKYTYADEVYGIIYNDSFKLNYITVPIMASWHFGRNANWYLNFGPYAGFLLSAKESLNIGNAKSEFTSTDFGADVGLGIKFHISDNLQLFIESEGQGGVTNVFKDSQNSSVQNARSSINIGINF